MSKLRKCLILFVFAMLLAVPLQGLAAALPPSLLGRLLKKSYRE
jgi:hypothetical protein